uniref:Uncharacterized protein n=1 Tax=viral metagenome TaxID=1070528 RepID=A0A6H1ZWP7_9ZZZZ
MKNRIREASLSDNSMKAVSCPWCGAKDHPVPKKAVQTCQVCGNEYITDRKV